MNKEKEIRSLTWKYFWKQKIQEVQKYTFISVLILLGITAMAYIPYLIGHSIGDNKSIYCNDMWERVTECSITYQWFEGFIYLFIVVIVIVIIYSWISSNWKKANKLAKEDINKIEKGGKNERKKKRE